MNDTKTLLCPTCLMKHSIGVLKGVDNRILPIYAGIGAHDCCRNCMGWCIPAIPLVELK